MARVSRLRVKFDRLMRLAGFRGEWFLIPLAAVVGTLAGLVATGFSLLVEFCGNLFFGRLGRQEFPGSVWLLLILLPALGGLLVGLIQTYLSRTGPTHGIPEVMEALSRQRGRMPIRMGLFKTITASLTIGSGGSAGVEGPIIQTGSVLGSVVGQVLRVGRDHMTVLVGCGAAGGMAGIFNAPIAAVLFVLEVMLRDFSFKTFTPIVVASVFGTAIAQALLGRQEAVFALPEAMTQYEFVMVEIAPYAVLGILCGLVGAMLSRGERLSESLWQRTPTPRFLRPALGGMLLGVLGIVFVFGLGFSEPIPGYHPPLFFSNGYRVIEALMNPASYTTEAGEAAGMIMPASPVPLYSSPVIHAGIGLLLVMLVFKLVGTALTIGSGGSGGFIAPSLFLGATLGGAFAMILQRIGLFPGLTPATYALAGMAGVIAATVHCPLTAFLLVFELTHDYKVILPIMVVAILAMTSAQFVSPDSIYTSWLRKRGIRMGTLTDMTLLRRLEVNDVPLNPAVIVTPNDPAQRLLELASDYAATDFVVCDEADQFVGMVVGEDLRTTFLQREAIPLMIVSELMRSSVPTVTGTETLDLVLDKFSRHDVASLPVVDDKSHVRGVITRSRLMRQYQRLLNE